MRLDQLNYVYQVAKYGSINETAKHLYISQSTISTAITALENELGVQIFNRSKSGVRLTDIGEGIAANIAEILDRVENIHQLSLGNDGHLKGVLRVVAYKSFLCADNLRLIQKIKANYPNIAIFLEEKRTPQVIEDVQNGNVNFGIVICERREEDTFCKTLSASGIAYRYLYEDQINVFCGAKHPLAGCSVPFEQLRQYPVIGFSNLCVLPNLADFERAYNVDTVDAMKKLLTESDTHITFLYQAHLAEDLYIETGQIKTIEISDLSLPSSVWAIYLKGTVLSFIERELLEQYQQ